MAETRESLIHRVRDPADAESWREFVALYQPLLLAYVLKLGLTEADARDVVQDTFARLVMALPGFELDHSRGRFRTWLWQVTRNAMADWGRRKVRRTKAEEGWREASPPIGDEAAEEPDAYWRAAHRRRILEVAMERVQSESQPRTWACFAKHVHQGRRAADVAKELEISVNAVYVNASRVLERLRQQCADYSEELDDESGP